MRDPYELDLFYNWLNDYPDDLGEDDDMSFAELGLKPGAPQSAVDAYEEYVKKEEKEEAYWRNNAEALARAGIGRPW